MCNAEGWRWSGLEGVTLTVVCCGFSTCGADFGVSNMYQRLKLIQTPHPLRCDAETSARP